MRKYLLWWRNLSKEEKKTSWPKETLKRLLSVRLRGFMRGVENNMLNKC